MPHLVFANRYWRFSSDEFWCSGILTIIGRICWSVLLITLIILSARHLSNCRGGHGIQAYLIATLLIFWVTISTEAIIIYISITGTLVDNQRRDKEASRYLVVHGAFEALQHGAAIVGAIVLWSHVNVPCQSHFSATHNRVSVLLAVVVVLQLADAAKSLCCCVLCASRHVASKEEPRERVDDDDLIMQKWESRISRATAVLQCFSCNIFGGSNANEDLQLVARVITDFSHHDGFLDAVPSDIMAGMVLVRMQQLEERHETERRRKERKQRGDTERGRNGGSNGGEPSIILAHVEINVKASDMGSDTLIRDSSREGRVFDPEANINDRMILKELARYSVYALAIYSHLLALYMQPVTGLCGMAVTNARHVGCCSIGSGGRSVHAPGTVGDSCLQVSETGMLHISTRFVKSAKLLFASFKNETYLRPYAIFIDEDGVGEVVIVIRGTLSLEDCIADAIADSVELREAGERWGFDGVGRYAHGGMLRSALKIREELEQQGVLARAMGTTVEGAAGGASTSVPTHYEHDSDPRPLRRLVVVGHSLGAGAAILLALMLRKKYPRTHCVGFGTPGSVVDQTTATECSSFVTSVVHGIDVVSRVSIKGIVNIREKILDCIARAKVSKLAVMQSVLSRERCRPGDYMHPPGHAPDSQFKRRLDAFNEVIRERFAEGDNHMYKDLAIPGKIIHLEKIQQPRSASSLSCSCCCALPVGINKMRSDNLSENDDFQGSEVVKGMRNRQQAYKVVEDFPENFTEILLSPTMLLEHFPDQYMLKLQNLCEQWQINGEDHNRSMEGRYIPV